MSGNSEETDLNKTVRVSRRGPKKPSPPAAPEPPPVAGAANRPVSAPPPPAAPPNPDLGRTMALGRKSRQAAPPTPPADQLAGTFMPSRDDLAQLRAARDTPPAAGGLHAGPQANPDVHAAPPVAPAVSVPAPPIPVAQPAPVAAPSFFYRLPTAALAGAVGALLLVATLLAVYLFWPDKGFTLIVKVSAEARNCKVLVNGAERGIAQNDGSIKVESLSAGTKEVRVQCPGYEFDAQSVTGRDGDLKTLNVSPRTAVKTPEPTPPPVSAPASTEIDYNGPMILIPAGRYIMGDDTHQPDERPAREEDLPAYYIDKLEVTNEQYKKFCDATGHPQPAPLTIDLTYFTSRPQAPVLNVSWNDAVAYAQWTGKRLPDEKEWEKAASWDPAGNSKRQWPWGNSREAGRANVGGSRPVEAGKFKAGASAYGVLDMAGNVAEWVQDAYTAYPGNTANNPDFGPGNRVFRGGSCKSSLNDARATFRDFRAPELTPEQSFLIGFRCAVAADDPKLQDFLSKRR